MRLSGMPYMFFVACLCAILPLYSRCENHSSVPQEIHGVSRGVPKTNSSSNSSSTNVTQHVLKNANLTSTPENKSALSEASNASKVSLNSSALLDHPNSQSGSSHASVPSPSKVEQSTQKTPSHQQVMEGGGSLPPKKGHSDREKPLSESSIDPENIISSTSLKPHKNISARKGAPVEMLTEMPAPPLVDETTREAPNSTTVRPVTRKTTRKMKPFFTMIKGDKLMKESESFIESSTTGKDYVLPLVLIIFTIPAFIFLVKFLYRRGTEFTERQQYHRMYLIDGDPYSTDWFESCRRAVKNVLWKDKTQTVNLTNFGDVGLNPRMNYHSF